MSLFIQLDMNPKNPTRAGSINNPKLHYLLIGWILTLRLTQCTIIQSQKTNNKINESYFHHQPSKPPLFKKLSHPRSLHKPTYEPALVSDRPLQEALFEFEGRQHVCVLALISRTPITRGQLLTDSNQEMK